MRVAAGGHERERYATEEGLAALLRDAVANEDFPQYGYGVVQATALAGRLGVGAVTVLELGVAGGNGLLELQRLCDVHAASGIDLQPVGFDLGNGMPHPRDHRDMPYIWQRGFYRLDRENLEPLLGRAELVLGDIANTGPSFLARKPPPIGFVAFDLDYYSSTKAAFDALLHAEPERYLPRVVCYFDDTVGPHFEMHSQFTGELLAIDELNNEDAPRKLGKLNGLRYKLAPYDASWIEGVYVLHVFDHPRYGDYVYPVADRQFHLTHHQTAAAGHDTIASMP